MYCIVDLETTGARNRHHKVTEVGIVLHDGQEMVDEFSSLINPQRPIPPDITEVTGITDEMVQDAPLFEEVAEKVRELTDGAVFVAHNVQFDYRFLQQEFRQLGMQFQRERLCTVQYTKKVFPGWNAYNLDAVCAHLDIPVVDRHRALGDARATAQLLGKLLKEDEEDWAGRLMKDFQSLVLPPQLSADRLNALPEKTGMYYFHDKDGKTLFVGCADNIADKVFKQLKDSKRSNRSYHQKVADVQFEPTGSRLIAQLKQAEAIRQLSPPYNRPVRPTYNVVVTQSENEDGYLELRIEPWDEVEQPVLSLPDKEDARQFLTNKVQQFRLCGKLCGLEEGSGACSYYPLNLCPGSCVGEESPDSYNQRVEKAIWSVSQGSTENIAIIGDGRAPDERSVVLMEKGGAGGWGYFDPSFVQAQTIEPLKEVIDFREMKNIHRQLIQQYLRQHHQDRVIRF